MNARDINLTPAELKAIEDHKYFLSQQKGVEVSIEEAIEDFLKRFAEDWWREKLWRDNAEQRHEMERHKYVRSEQAGRDVGGEAVVEWCEKYAHIWRAERESLERNGFQRITVVIKNPLGVHLRPLSSVAMLASKFDCDIYVHKDSMPFWNFLLEGRPYMNVKSIVGFLSLGIVVGDRVDFIATGAHAAEALAALAGLLAETHAAEGDEIPKTGGA